VPESGATVTSDRASLLDPGILQPADVLLRGFVPIGYAEPDVVLAQDFLGIL
jgi:hypothetical protein